MSTTDVPLALSASTVAATVATGSHVFRIDSFSRAGMLANGKCLKSCEFHAGGHAWRVRCYPNGRQAKYAGFVSLALELASGSAKNVRAELRFTLLLLRPRGGPAPATTPKYQGAYTVTFEKKQSHCVLEDFIRREALQKSAYLGDDDCLAVRCDVTVLSKPGAAAPVVQARELERLGLLCTCKEELCKRLHAGTAEAAAAFSTPQRRRRLFGCLQI